MKVILLNNNPAVSKLASVSLNKLGYEFVEIDNLETIVDNEADLIICDSGLYNSEVNYLEYAQNQLFLIPRNQSNQYDIAQNEILQKPFLPTDFIDIIKVILKDTTQDIQPPQKEPIPVDNDIKVGNKFGEIQDIDEMDFSSSNDELSDFNDLDSNELLNQIDDMEDQFVENEFNEFDDTELSFTEDVEDLNKGLEEITQIDEIKEEPIKEQLEEISEVSDDFIEEFDDISQIDQTTQSNQIAKTDEFAEVSGEFAEIDDKFEKIDDSITELSDEINPVDDELIVADNKKEEFVSFETISEFQKSDTNKDDKISQEIDEVAKTIDISKDIKESTSKSQNIKDITSEYENIKLDISAFDELPDEESTLDEKSEPTIKVEEVQDPMQISDLDYTDNLNELSNMLDEIDNMDYEEESVNQMVENESKIASLNSCYEASTIDEIDEAAIKEALHEDTTPTQTLAADILEQQEPKEEIVATDSSNINKDELAQVLATQIGQELGKALNTGAFKDMLKDINININISFEGKQ
ncbi:MULTISPECIES: hypothetical protein [Campylobacter]|uniref:Highly acidic protein n=1 Tax=Campylobacter vicugnae TaxID=1660076 RepID=A0ABZ2E6P9_9BACT|nr:MULTISPECIES: hypothetical protein [unclassified Campylobacter]ARR04369.1 ATPase, AAA family [Campylobacter sp. RM12175]MCR8689638.1 hypothetical protein [Campylobacter sp. RM9264]MCR8700919.1 hypothetical protein [Campylobacter sp. RM12176]